MDKDLLKQSEEKYRLLFERAPLGYQSLDMNGNILEVNKAWLEFFGFSKKEVLGKWFGEFLVPEHGDLFKSKFQYFKEVGEIYNVEYEVVRKNGLIALISCYGVIEYDKDGNFEQTHCFFHDITVHKKEQKQLRLLSSAVEQASEGIAIADLEGNLNYLNDAFATIHGYVPEELLGKNLSIFHTPEQLPAVKAANRQIQKSGEFHGEIWRKRKDGTVFPSLMHNSILLDDEGNKIGMIGTFINITEQKETERKLKESEEKYRQIIDNISDIIIEMTINGNLTYISPQVYDILGYKPEEIIKKNAFELIHPEDLPNIVEMIKQDTNIESGNIKKTLKYRIQHKKGHYITVSTKGTIDMAKGNTLFAAVIRDITASQIAEQKLRESEELFRTVFETAEDCMFVKNRSLQYTQVNKAMTKLFNMPATALLDKTDVDLFGKEAGKHVIEVDQRVIKGEIIEEEYTKPVQGVPHTFHTIKVPLKDSKGIIYGLYGIARDITERKLADIKLKESEEKFRSITEQSLMGIAILQDDRYKYVNQQFAEITGYTEEELLNLAPGGYKKLIHSKDWEFVEDQAVKKQLGKKNIIIRYEFRGIKKSGETNWLEIFSKSILYQGKIADLISAIDITGRKKIEQKLIESEENLREAYNRADFYKDIFTHDINNILSNIKSSIELSSLYLKDPQRINDIQELYEIIREQFTKGSSLVSNIRKLSQIEESVSLMKPVEINDILKKEIDFILKSYQTRDVKIRTHGFEQGVFVIANDLLIDLFNNLLNNSIKYNDSKIVEIDIKMAKEKKRNINYIKLEFSDNGIGIPNERKATLFEEEYVKDISSKGLGIGLTLVKKIVESYKGEIWVEDRIKGDYRQGCNFIVLIPESK